MERHDQIDQAIKEGCDQRFEAQRKYAETFHNSMVDAINGRK